MAPDLSTFTSKKDGYFTQDILATSVSRRHFVAFSAGIAALLAAPGVLRAMPLPETTALSADTARALQAMIWHLFPIQDMPEESYANVLKALDGKAADEGFSGLMQAGVAMLNKAAGGSFADVDGPAQIAAMKVVQGEPSPFFFLVRDTTVATLFNDRALWALVGFEGSSVEHGGYLERGFDDIDWLPKT